MVNRRRWIWTLVTLGAALATALALIASVIPLRSEALKQRIVESLGQKLNSDVSLEDLSLRLYPRLHAEGRGLLIRQRGRLDQAPMIAVKRFTVDADLIGILRRRVNHVDLDGLDISIPPDEDGPRNVDDARSHRLHGTGEAVATRGTAATRPAWFDQGVVINRLDATAARLIIVPREKTRTPKTWAIHKLAMRDVGIAEAMPFEATLTNAVPPGEIATNGNFGPWDRDIPGKTPLEGSFTFEHADLSVFKGISGSLASRGSFSGSLDYIDVYGETDTPDFTIAVGGHPFALAAKYHTIVDGTNGDTRLERIDARFLQTELVAHGAVLDGPPGQAGRTVTLDVVIPEGRIEDLMRMAVNTPTSPMTGALELTTTFLLPPGETDVVDRLRLNGRFSMTQAKFSNPDVQNKILELSLRGRGRPVTRVKDPVASDFRGHFVLGNGRLALNRLIFAVPGAQVQLAGAYALKRERLAFKGHLLIDAKVSQTVTGFKSLLLKIVDPLFSRRGGGSSIPIKIEGTRSDPKFGLDMGRVFKGGA